MRIRDAITLTTKVFQYNLDQFQAAIDAKKVGGIAHNTFLVPFFIGDPGLGKTAIPRQVARMLDVPYFQTIIAQYDAGEMAGLPFVSTVEYDAVDEKGDAYKKSVNRMVRMRPTYLPDIDDDEQIVGIYNLDELPQAFLANQNICSQMVNEWRVGEHPISEGVTIVATGNKPENKAGTTSMPMHLRDRLMFIEIEANHDDFLDYAATVGIDPRVRTFIRQNSQYLHKFEVGVNAFPSPRSWEKVGSVLKMDWKKDQTHIRYHAIAGQIGDGVAKTFEAWLRVEDKMPKWQDVVAAPQSAPVFGNKDADVLYLLLGTLADKADEKNIEAILTYIRRLPAQEFSAMWAKETFLRHPKLLENKHVTAWKMKDGAKIMF